VTLYKVPRISGYAKLLHMTEHLEEIIERVKTWPASRQDDAAYLLHLMEEAGTSVYRLSDEEREAVLQGLNSPVASGAKLKAFRDRHKA
jgi:type II secretory pathway predicted ATPase ExeA